MWNGSACQEKVFVGGMSRYVHCTGVEYCDGDVVAKRWYSKIQILSVSQRLFVFDKTLISMSKPMLKASRPNLGPDIVWIMSQCNLNLSLKLSLHTKIIQNVRMHIYLHLDAIILVCKTSSYYGVSILGGCTCKYVY